MRTYGLIGVVIWIGIIALFSSDCRLLQKENLCGRKVYRYNIIFAILAFLPVILWAGFREANGYGDTGAYIDIYSKIPTALANLREYFTKTPDDKGFTLLLFVIKSVFGENYTPFLMIMALIEGFAVIFFYRKYSSNYVMSLFLFITSAEYFSWMFNGMRQFLAVAIIMFAFPLLLKKEYFKFFIVVILASTIHMTAIIMIPFAIIAMGKPWNHKTILMIGIAVFAIFMTSRFTDILSVATQNTQYGDAVVTWTESGDDGTNPIRVIVYAIPTVLAFFKRRNLEALQDPVIDICVNMSILSTVMWVISMVTSGIYMGRLPVYAGVFNYILLPCEIDTLFTENSKKIVRVLMILMYLLYYYYQMHNTWGLL